MGNAGRPYGFAMLVSLAVMLVGVAGIFAFPPTKSDETWVRFACFVLVALGGSVALLVSAVGCLVAAIVARRRGGRRGG